MKLILNKSVLAALPLAIALAGGVLSLYEVANPPQQQIPASHVSMDLPAAVKNGWPQTDWWKDYHDPQLNNLIQRSVGERAGYADCRTAHQACRSAGANVAGESWPGDGFLRRY